MKENISSNEIKYINRRLAPRLRTVVDKFPVTVLSGARQVGKSTLLKHEFPDFTYLTMDDFTLREQARIDPASLWAASDRVIIDEAQKMPGIFEAIKLAVDRTGRAKRFILSGSANLLLLHKITESLAGRAMYLELLPMTYGETAGSAEALHFNSLWNPKPGIAGETVPVIDPLPFMMRGFMPPLLDASSHSDVLSWLDGYVRTYLERDLRELSQVESIVDFRKVMQSLALRTGRILNQADVAKDSGVSNPTTHRYIKLLETSNIIQRVPAFSRNRTKRVVKSPKLFFTDPALPIFLSGYYDQETFNKSREKGHYFETLAYLHISALCETMTPKPGLFYWRTVSGREVDFVIEHGRKLLAIEVKYSVKPSVFDITGILAFMEEHPETVLGVLIHAGADVMWLHSRVLAVPWWWVDV